MGGILYSGAHPPRRMRNRIIALIVTVDVQAPSGDNRVMDSKNGTLNQHEPRGRYSLADRYYYLRNFETVLASLNARYADLWSNEELQFLGHFDRLPKASRALLVRMVMRKGDLFRASRLNYPEIGEASVARAPLVDMGWIDANPRLDIDQLQRLLRKAELMQYCRLTRVFKKLKKNDLVKMLRTLFPEPKPFHAWCANSSDRVYRLDIAPLCERFRLMFFGNFHQDWSEFVLTDLGVFRYERIPSSSQSRPFSSRTHIDALQQLYLCRQRLDAGLALNQVMAGIPPPITDSDWMEDQRQSILFQAARAAERTGDRPLALAIYTACTHRGARLRRIRLLERACEWQSAEALCLTARQNPESETERQQLSRLLPRLNRKLGASPRALNAPQKVVEFELVMGRPADGRAVEYCVLNSLARQAGGNTTIHYVENGLINSLFGLLCWKAIFAPIAGAFFHDFQYGPADLSHDHFYERRRQEFDDCFAELASDQYKTTIRRCLSAKAGIQSPFVVWRMLKKPLLESALTCIPAVHLRTWFEWIARDIRENRAGFPDLVQFWPLEHRYRMIEVKGPGDRLQDNQRRLFELCASHKMPVSVCHVRWAEAARTVRSSKAVAPRQLTIDEFPDLGDHDRSLAD